MKEGTIIKTGCKYGILGEFEIGNSGVYAQRILISNISKRKAKQLLNKWLNNTLQVK